MRGELRIGVVMSGGVSLAIWMGGVAHQLLRLVESPQAFGIPDDHKPSIDVIAGTSAGGINGTLLAAALAWGVDSRRFHDDLRNTWLEIGSIQTLLRSPFDADPPSLFKGDEILSTGVAGLLRKWWNTRVTPTSFRMHLVMTTTLLNPELGSYQDDLGIKIVEPLQAGAFTFKTDDFANETIIEKLALAARASASYPVAFEPAFVSVGSESGRLPDMAKHANFDNSHLTVDGGIIVNRPFRHALKGIIEQPASDHVKRWLAYIIPDPGPTDRANEPDSLDPPLSLTGMMGKVAAAGFSQSLAEDLRDWQEHQRVYSRQLDYRYWLADLGVQTRSRMLSQAYPRFRIQRTQESARTSMSRLLTARTAPSSARWSVVAGALLIARQDPLIDWHPKSWADAQQMDLTGLWQWGLASLEYLSQIVLDLITKTWAATDPARASTGRTRIHQILDVLRRYRALDDTYWRWAVGTKATNTEWLAWACAAYRAWPQVGVDLNGGGRSDTVDLIELTHQASEIVNAIRSALPETSGPLNDDAAPLTQPAYRQHLSALAAEIAGVYRDWRRHVDIDACGANQQKVANAIGGPRVSASKAIVNMLGFWVIQMTSQPHGIVWEQPIRLVQISADIPSCVAPSFSTATDKLAGVQLAHFGAFYKSSWRANDWMWGKLDGLDRLLRLGDAVVRDRETNTEELTDPSPGSLAALNSDASNNLNETIAGAQRELLTTELVALRREIRISHEAGGGLSTQAKRFEAAVDQVLSDGDGRTIPIEETGPLLGMVPRERIAGEVTSNQFAQTLTTTAGVAATALQGSRGGLGSFRHIFGQIRNLVILPFYLLAQAVTAGTGVASFVAFASFLLATVLIVVDITLPNSDLPSILVTLAWVAVAFWLLFSIGRVSTGWRSSMAMVAVLPLVAVGGAFMADWVIGGVDTVKNSTTCTIPLDQVVLNMADGNVEVTLEGCTPQQPSTDKREAAANSRARRARNGLAVVGLAATGICLWGLIRQRAWVAFLVGFATAVLGASMVVLPAQPILRWPVAFGLAVLALALWRMLRWKAAPVASGARIDGELEQQATTTAQFPRAGKMSVLIGVVTGAAFAGVTELAAGLGESMTPSPVLVAVVRSMTQNPGWTLVVIILLPTAVGVVSSAIARGHKRPEPLVPG